MKNKDRFNTLEEAQNAFEEFCRKQKAKRFEEIGYHSCGACRFVKARGGCLFNWLFSEEEFDVKA